MHLVVGLGNPGEKYAWHRHNIGFMAIDAIARAYRFTSTQKKFHGLVLSGHIGTARVLLLKPQTFMNNCGPSVAQAARFYRLDGAHVIVFHDELDLAPGKVRVKRAGGSGGHNGLRSIDRHMGNDYVRVRLGIGHPGHRAGVNRRVLSDFSGDERVWLSPLLQSIGAHAALMLQGEHGRFMNAVTLDVRAALPRVPVTKGGHGRT